MLTKQEKVEDQARGSLLSKGWFINFRDCLKYQGSRSSSFCWRGQQTSSQMPWKLLKEYLPDQIFNADEFSYSGKRHKGHLVVRKRSEQQDLWQEGGG